MQASIHLNKTPEAQYLLRIGDTCLILGQRLGEWCGHAPVLEEDIAMANIALDLIGQARAVLSLAAQLEGLDHDEDQLAFLRDERDYLNLTLVELPRGDFAFSVLRNTMVSTWLKLLWERLAMSSNNELAAIAGKAIKEARYHQQHSGDWVVRLGDGTPESTRRMKAALSELWRYVPEMFDTDGIDHAAHALGLGPLWSGLETGWNAEITLILEEAGLQALAGSAFRSHGKRGQHSEHMGYILTDMQYLQRTFPGGVW
ncbi:MAG: 1,2-phenylacetyl-CoA epoxidase subunit PaaC [Pseudomonadota bacterium]